MSPLAHSLLMAVIGGVVIGLSTIVLLASLGRIAGISGIIAGFMDEKGENRQWRAMFLAGMIAAGIVLYLIRPDWFGEPIARSPVAMVAAGLLVGYGTRLGSGCTSGHGICGLSRFSIRSLVAVLSFMGSGILTVYLIQHVLGGSV